MSEPAKKPPSPLVMARNQHTGEVMPCRREGDVLDEIPFVPASVAGTKDQDRWIRAWKAARRCLGFNRADTTRGIAQQLGLHVVDDHLPKS